MPSAPHPILPSACLVTTTCIDSSIGSMRKRIRSPWPRLTASASSVRSASMAPQTDHMVLVRHLARLRSVRCSRYRSAYGVGA